jgi:hypothetical protein
MLPTSFFLSNVKENARKLFFFEFFSRAFFHWERNKKGFLAFSFPFERK